MTKLTALAVDNLDLLHELDAAAPQQTARGVADRLGRDESNLAKTLKKLREEGLVGEGVALTDAGRAATRLLAADGEILADDATLLLRRDRIAPDPDNARTDFDPLAIDALAEDIAARSRPGRVGLLHALTVLPPLAGGGPWRLRGGWRRWLAIGRLIDAGRLPADAPIPCVRHDGLDAAAAALMAIVENVQREDLHPLDEGGAYARLTREHQLSLDAIAAAVRKSKKHVADHIAIVEKLGADAQRRMRLPKDHDDHLGYVAARKLMQSLGARPKPAVDVDVKEALVLMEVADRCKARPSHDPYAHGRDGWTRAASAPQDSIVGAALGAKALIETREREDGRAAYVRLVPAKATEIRQWIVDRGAMSLWSARSDALGSGIAAELERAGRYATPWLNDPLEDEAPAAPPAPAMDAPAQHAAAPVEAATGAPETASAQIVAETAAGEAEEPGSEPLPPYLAKLAGVPETPAAETPAPETPDLALTVEELTVLADVAAKIAATPLAGRLDPRTGQPAFVGCAVGAFSRDPIASRLTMQHRLLAFVPSARDEQMCTLTAKAAAWLAANPQPPRRPPYATAWLNPAVAAAPEPPQAAPTAVESDGRLAAPMVYFAKPIITVTGFSCGNCEQTIPLDDEQVELAASARFDSIIDAPGPETCPHCQQPIIRLAAEVYYVRSGV